MGMGTLVSKSKKGQKAGGQPAPEEKPEVAQIKVKADLAKWLGTIHQWTKVPIWKLVDGQLRDYVKGEFERVQEEMKSEGQG